MTETLVESTNQLSLSQEEPINKGQEQVAYVDANDADDNGEHTTIHPLEYEWTFWYDKRPATGKRLKGEQESYESNLRAIGTCGSVSFRIITAYYFSFCIFLV